MSNAVQAASYIQNSFSSSAEGQAFGSDNSAGNSIIVIVMWESASGTMAINDPTNGVNKDSNGNSYTSIQGPDALGGQYSAQVFLASNIAAGANTVTVKPGQATFWGMAILEYTQAFGSVDQFVKQTGSGTSMTTGTTPTTTSASELILAYFTNGYGGATFSSPGAGYSIETSKTGSSTQDLCVIDQIASSEAAFTGTVSQSVSVGYGSWIVTLPITVPVVNIVAAISGASAVTAALTGIGALAGSISGSSLVTAALTGAGSLASSIAGTSTLAEATTGSGALAGSIDGNSLVTAVLTSASAGITGSIAGGSAVSATLTGFTVAYTIDSWMYNLPFSNAIDMVNNASFSQEYRIGAAAIAKRIQQQVLTRWGGSALIGTAWMTAMVDRQMAQTPGFATLYNAAPIAPGMDNSAIVLIRRITMGMAKKSDNSKQPMEASMLPGAVINSNRSATALNRTLTAAAESRERASLPLAFLNSQARSSL